MGISDKIETFIIELLKEDDGWVELGRNELASVFQCVPSQINYVISTRFRPAQGYLVESRRGGGGYLRIKRIRYCGIAEVVNSIGSTISEREARSLVAELESAGEISRSGAALMMAGISEKSLLDAPIQIRPRLRAEILRNMLLASVE